MDLYGMPSDHVVFATTVVEEFTSRSGPDAAAFTDGPRLDQLGWRHRRVEAVHLPRPHARPTALRFWQRRVLFVPLATSTSPGSEPYYGDVWATYEDFEAAWPGFSRRVTTRGTSRPPQGVIDGREESLRMLDAFARYPASPPGNVGVPRRARATLE
jgi:hypothetical protein